jgi:hypothetical protein
VNSVLPQAFLSATLRRLQNDFSYEPILARFIPAGQISNL